MPLLGRHKSLPGGAKQAGQQQAGQPAVCESPLFGTRRQLPSPGTSGADPQQPAQQQQTGKQRALAPKSSAPAALQAGQSGEPSLGSIPKQISRQQIHYAFSIMDTNSDGLVDLRDLSQMLANLGVPIDESILSHVMSSVSKRGDHRISESEFLEWIGNFIQVSDLQLELRGQPAARTPVARSASALVAQSAEAQQQLERQMRQRRGSGSGQALMRSLSSSSSSSSAPSSAGVGAAKGGGAAAASSSAAKELERRQLQLAEQQQEARQDLKAAFCVFDLDGDGYITLDEVQQGLKLLGESWTLAELNQLLFSRCAPTSSGGAGASKWKVAGRSVDARGANAAALATPLKRISIDDFVALLL